MTSLKLSFEIFFGSKNKLDGASPKPQYNLTNICAKKWTLSLVPWA